MITIILKYYQDLKCKMDTNNLFKDDNDSDNGRDPPIT